MATKKTILIVEDSATLRYLMVHMLSRKGFDIVEAGTGFEAIDRARAILPDGILMDLGLPGMTGDEAIACLKADPLTRHIPIVVNTAYHEQSRAVQRAIAAGAAEIFYKPADMNSIEEVLHRLVAAQESESIPLNIVGQDPARSAEINFKGGEICR